MPVSDHFSGARRRPAAGDAGGSRLRKLGAEESGVAATEFALILPILLALWFGGVEVTQALSIDRRLSNLAASMGDLAARAKMLTDAEVTAILDIGVAAMKPYPTASLSMRVTAVAIDADGNAAVSWSRGSDTGGSHPPHAVGTDMNGTVAESLRVPETQIIVAEAYYTYQPTVGYVLTSDIELESRAFFVPRLTVAVKLCNDAGEECVPA